MPSSLKQDDQVCWTQFDEPVDGPTRDAGDGNDRCGKQQRIGVVFAGAGNDDVTIGSMPRYGVPQPYLPDRHRCTAATAMMP